jgi:hypothetical protein
MPSEAIADPVGTRENIRKAHCEGYESGQMNKQRPLRVRDDSVTWLIKEPVARSRSRKMI